MKSIRLHFQDENYTLREYVGSFNGSWTLNPPSGFQIPASGPLGSLAAVVWVGGGVQIRVYYQDASKGKLLELQYSNSAWNTNAFPYEILAWSDAVATVQQIAPGFVINIAWVGPDQLVHHLAWDPSQNSWIGPLTQSFVTKGPLVGHPVVNTFTSFNDLKGGAGVKVISKVRVSSSAVINGFAFDFADGTSTPWRGSQSADPVSEFALNAGACEGFTESSSTPRARTGETITFVLVVYDGFNVRRLDLVTSTGRQSGNYGNSSADPIILHQGTALRGFSGAFGKIAMEPSVFIKCLQPIWATD
ncbi:hypothetical protein PUNSTDRAFT_147064 [Punctularia strigosozonata HHB-11173 SS5]|uniref:Fucose-specific lectin n=1 Tax=Punctularia strigosozonata (strain HHB-11173) TaxID=741275 RepID=R7S285_PUNST|nr:uncharacterized protein PUNSTDRAFT_147064 [Punctularia strigosozonata HHB-11173 SS5]EIN03356.1 hypothetical protein PUNSTDRAFT_147064 [Punctularia strigosozonata HHB-11173 SS5]